MTPLAIAFMLGSWTFVLGLAVWSIGRVLRKQRENQAAAAAGKREEVQ